MNFHALVRSVCFNIHGATLNADFGIQNLPAMLAAAIK